MSAVPVKDLEENELMAVVHISMPIDPIEKGVHINRAVLISTAIVTTFLIMSGSYLIVRYVIVKPVKHLKEVSDAIARLQKNYSMRVTGTLTEPVRRALHMP